MDVEGTIEFILENQAKTEIRLGGITKLLQQGMRMLVKTDTKVAQLAEAQKRTDAKLARLADVHRELAAEVKGVAAEVKELAKAQRETERTLRAFIRAQRNGRNGRR